MGKYIITGGNGFVGQSLARHIRKNGHRAIIASRRKPKGDAGHDWIEYDLNQRTTAENIVQASPDGVFHLAWSTTPSIAEQDPAADVGTNLTGTVVLLQELARCTRMPLVFVSSGGAVYGKADILPIPEDHPLRPIGTYGLTKVTAENYANNLRRRFNMDIRVARLSNPFGASQPPDKLQGAATIFARKILQNQKIEIWGDGSVVRDYIDVDEASAGLMAIMTSSVTDPETMPVFNLGSGEGFSLNDLIKIIGDVSAIHPDVIYRESRSFDIPANVLDVTRIQKHTGWAPAKNTREALAFMIHSMMEA